MNKEQLNEIIDGDIRSRLIERLLAEYIEENKNKL